MTRQKPVLPYDSLLHVLEPETGEKVDTRLRGYDGKKGGYGAENGGYDDGERGYKDGECVFDDGKRGIDDEKNGRNNGRFPASPPSLNSTRAQKNFEIQCYQTLTSASSPQEFTDRITRILKQLGFTTFSFTTLTPVPHMLFNSLPKPLAHVYQTERLIRDDYAICYNQSLSAPILRSGIEDYMANAPVETRDMARNRMLSDLYKSHGIFDCYLIPIIDGNRRYLLSIMARTDDIGGFYDMIAACAPELALLGKLISQLGNLKFKNIFKNPEHSGHIRLTPRPRRLLTTLAKNDLTLVQVADRLGISIHTADKHIAVVKKAFGARTISGAVYMALKTGLIDMD